jgi:hypothetical protein
MSQTLNTEVSAVGIDIGKNSCTTHALRKVGTSRRLHHELGLKNDT